MQGPISILGCGRKRGAGRGGAGGGERCLPQVPSAPSICNGALEGVCTCRRPQETQGPDLVSVPTPMAIGLTYTIPGYHSFSSKEGESTENEDQDVSSHHGDARAETGR